ncbi:hypothetical protein FN846DRAFT_942632 [Sphaerosporella brunnea]|uniref:Uncharacterized protein n=1 Tax=Sphaerosporella brunnea TaxID=1250544 RepID=A0A5J5F258_9PEZI|nr:hypothetical protein FN846DRAFT_942632 [Sphaerosporella brunnea]
MLLPRHPPYSATHPHFGHKSAGAPYSATHPHFGGHKARLAIGAIIGIVIGVLVIFIILGWVLFKCLRARRLGLPKPTWRSFVPFMSSSRGNYAPTRPAATGRGGFLSLFRKSRGYTGANERSMRMREEAGAWDARMDDEHDHHHEAESYEYRGAPTGIKEAVLGRGREQDLSVGRENFQEKHEERGRSRNRGAEVYIERGDGTQQHAEKNPFEQDIRRKDGFGDVRMQGGRLSVDSERRSVFREEV